MPTNDSTCSDHVLRWYIRGYLLHGRRRWRNSPAVDFRHQRWTNGLGCRLEIGPVAVTELWIETEGVAPRRLGIFPGLPGSLAWVPEGDRLQYRETTLNVALYSLSIVPKRSVPLVSPGAWEISIRNGSVRRLAGTEIDNSGTPSDATVAGSPAPSKGAKAVLAGVAAAFKATALAYSTLHRWDFEEAEERYRKAAKSWEALPGRFSKQGLYKEPVSAYVKSAWREGREGQRTFGRTMGLPGPFNRYRRPPAGPRTGPRRPAAGGSGRTEGVG